MLYSFWLSQYFKIDSNFFLFSCVLTNTSSTDIPVLSILDKNLLASKFLQLYNAVDIGVLWDVGKK